jgi:hypothetical protein
MTYLLYERKTVTAEIIVNTLNSQYKFLLFPTIKQNNTHGFEYNKKTTKTSRNMYVQTTDNIHFTPTYQCLT